MNRMKSRDESGDDLCLSRSWAARQKSFRQGWFTLYIVDREEKQSWFASFFGALWELGYCFTFGVVGNALALLYSLFWFLPGQKEFWFPLAILDIIVFISLGALQLGGLICCLVDLSRRHTYQNWLRIVLVAVGVVLNFTPGYLFLLITGSLGNWIRL